MPTSIASAISNWTTTVTLSKKASRCQVVPRSVPGPDVVLRSGNSLNEFTPSQIDYAKRFDKCLTSFLSVRLLA